MDPLFSESVTKQTNTTQVVPSHCLIVAQVSIGNLKTLLQHPQVRRKRVARDYQLVARFYRENPIVQIGFGAKISPQKISNQVKAVKKGDGPKKELIEALKHFNQFMTAQEFQQVVSSRS